MSVSLVYTIVIIQDASKHNKQYNISVEKMRQFYFVPCFFVGRVFFDLLYVFAGQNSLCTRSLHDFKFLFKAKHDCVFSRGRVETFIHQIVLYDNLCIFCLLGFVCIFSICLAFFACMVTWYALM